MTETQFIRNNKEDWQKLENLLINGEKDADAIHDLFVKVSSDLSYARSYYPNRMVRAYLNNLTQRVYNSVKKTDKISIKQQIVDYYTKDLPQSIKSS